MLLLLLLPLLPLLPLLCALNSRLTNELMHNVGFWGVHRSAGVPHILGGMEVPKQWRKQKQCVFIGPHTVINAAVGGAQYPTDSPTQPGQAEV
jgi:hypothetical protein